MSGQVVFAAVALGLVGLLTLVNVGLAALTMKMYTEILKDQSQDRRAGKGDAK